MDTSIEEQISQVIRDLMVIKARLPPIIALMEEFKRFPEGDDLPVGNGIVLQMARDSFDMCVIHLASLREQLVSGPGLLTQLQPHYHRFQPISEADLKRSIAEHGHDHPGDIYVLSEGARGHNEALSRMFPNGPPTGEGEMEDMADRFQAQTRAIEDDRNKVRAHRYGMPPELAERFYLNPMEVQTKIKEFEQLLNDILLILERSHHSMSPPRYADPERTAAQLADIIVHGSIDQACVTHGIYPPWTGFEDVTPRYWPKRQEYFATQPKISPGV